MSGIAGIFYRNGRNVEDPLLQDMFKAMQYRGWDGGWLWRRGSFGLVKQMFHSTPWNRTEQESRYDHSTGLCVAADARIDNREDLIRALDLRNKPEPTDTEVIAAAYMKWGGGAPSRLIGDFALAVVDCRNQQVFLARDPLGIKQMFYWLDQDKLVFGTTISAVLAALSERPDLNLELVFSTLYSNYELWVHETAYRSLMRVPGGFSLAVDKEKSFKRQYYSLGAESPLSYDNEAQCVEAFSELLTQAVHARTASTASTAVLVSGGLDSAAIAAVSHRTSTSPIQFQHLGFDLTPYGDEGDYVEKLCKWYPDVPLQTISADRLWALKQFGARNGFPFDEPDPHITRTPMVEQLETARDSGNRVVLSGDGDKVFGFLFLFEPNTLRFFGPRTVWTALAFYRAHGRNPWSALLRACLSPIIPDTARALRHRAHLRSGRFGHSLTIADALDLGFIGRYKGLYANESHANPWSSRRVMLDSLRSGYDSARYSFMDRAAAYAGVEKRWPFLDRRLVDFLINIPSCLRFGTYGNALMTKRILREAMEGMVPPEVLKRKGGGSLSGLVGRGLERERPLIGELVKDMKLARLGLLEEQGYRRFFNNNLDLQTRRGLTIFQPLLIESWLREKADSFSNIDGNRN